VFRKLLLGFIVCFLIITIANGQEEFVTRIEFIQLVNDVLDLGNTGDVYFEDINDTYKFHDDIAVAIEHGYISGYSDNTIRPNKLITKEEAGAILSRLYKNEIESEKILIRDKSFISDWCNKSVQEVVASKIMDLEEGCFYPKKKLTKIEAKKYINNLKYINDRCLNINKPGIYDLEGKVFLNININSKGVSIKNFESDKLTIDHKGKVIVANAKIEKFVHEFNEKELNLCNLNITGSMQLSYVNNAIKIKSIGENSFSICKAENIEKILLGGKYNEIKIKETSSNIVLVENVKIEKLEISNNSGITKIENKLNSDIEELILNSKSEFLGLGRIDFAKGDALEESIFRRLPKNLMPERKETSKKQEIFNVIFYDYYGEIAKKQFVNEGQSATPPELANVGQNLFDGWDKSYNSINNNLDIYPIYKKLDDSKKMKIKELGSKGDLSQEENVYKIDDNSAFGYKTLVIKKSKMPFNLDKYEKYTYKMNDLVKEFEENIFDNDLILVNISQFAKDETIEDSIITAYLN